MARQHHSPIVALSENNRTQKSDNLVEQRVYMGEGEVVSVSMYGVMTSWFTPSCLFIFVNLVIGTIAITSRFANPRKRQLDSPAQLVRSPSSLLERVTSFGLGSYKYEPVETQRVVEPVQNHDSPLDRVRSFNLGICKTEKHQDPDDPTRNELTRAPSLLERIMSVKFHRSESVKAEGKKPGSGSGPEPEPEIMGGRDLVLVDGRGEEEGVDAKADDFIKRFKQQLRLERLDSILRYRDILQRK